MIIHGDTDELGEKITINQRLDAIKLWKDKTVIPIPEGSDGDKQIGPVNYLPEEDPDPAKVVNIDSRR